jgi:hypothetical protein
VRRQRLGDVQHRVGFGTLAAVKPVLAPRGWQIHTAGVERSHRTSRQHGAAGGRRGSTLGKGEDGLLEPWAVCQGYDTCCLPHASFRQPLPQPEPPTGTGSAQRWRRA